MSILRNICRIFRSALLSLITITGSSSQASAEGANIPSYYTMYVKSGAAPLAQILEQLKTTKTGVISGVDCQATSDVATVYPAQRPGDLAMLIVSVDRKSECYQLELEMVRPWYKEPQLIVIRGISFPSVSGSN